MSNTNNESLDFITSVIERSIDPETLTYKEPTKEDLVVIVKGLKDTLGIETKGRSKEDITKNIQDMIKNSDVLNLKTKKDAQDIFRLFMDAYPRLLEESVTEKNKKLQDQITENSNQLGNVKKEWGSSILGSIETSSDYINVTYIDELMKSQLKGQSKKQLHNIKNLLLANPNSKINKDRLTIKNGFVVIDGFGLPDKVTPQKYANMAAENSDQLYPDYTIALLNFTAELTGKTFDRGTLNNKNLTDRSLSYKKILEILDTDNNNAILQSLSTIMGEVNEYQYIPMGIDNNGYVIYAGLSPGLIRFFCGGSHSDGDNCLVPSHIGG